MNLMFITPGMLFGGAERVISILSNEWTKMGIKVSIVITSEHRECVYPLSKEIRLIHLNGLKKEKIFPHIELIKDIRKIIKEKKPDAVISFMNDICAYTAISILGLKIPLFYSERNDPNKVNQDIKNKIYRKIVEFFSTGIVFQTEGAKKCYSVSVQKKSKVILNPMIINNFPECDYSFLNEEIVSVGRLVYQKNHKLLIEAFSIVIKKYPTYKLKIYGSGNLKGELFQLIEKLGLENSIFLMGNSNNVLNEIKRSKLFVLTSNFEGLPNALIEAMAIGLPCISTDCSPGGARMLIEEGKNGYIVPCDDKNILAEMIIKILSDNKKLKEIGEEAKKIKIKVDSKKIAQSWLEFFKDKIEDNKNENKL